MDLDCETALSLLTPSVSSLSRPMRSYPLVLQIVLCRLDFVKSADCKPVDEEGEAERSSSQLSEECGGADSFSAMTVGRTCSTVVDFLKSSNVLIRSFRSRKGTKCNREINASGDVGITMATAR